LFVPIGIVLIGIIQSIFCFYNVFNIAIMPVSKKLFSRHPKGFPYDLHAPFSGVAATGCRRSCPQRYLQRCQFHSETFSFGIHDGADRLQLLALWVIHDMGHQGHLFLPFFARKSSMVGLKCLTGLNMKYRRCLDGMVHIENE
jgi:hypothetical protein